MFVCLFFFYPVDGEKDMLADNSRVLVSLVEILVRVSIVDHLCRRRERGVGLGCEV